LDFIEAYEKGNVKGVQSTLENSDVDYLKKEYLHETIRTGNATAVKTLLKAGLDVNINKGFILTSAALYGHIEIVKIALEAGVDIQTFGANALKLAINKGNVDVVKLLLDANVPITREVLTAVIASTKEQIFDLVLPRTTPSDWETLLGYTVVWKKYDMLKRLFDFGVAAKGNLLYRAVSQNNKEMVMLLLHYGAEDRHLALKEAIIHNREEFIPLLYSEKLPQSVVDEMLLYAVNLGRLEIAKKLVELGASVETIPAIEEKITTAILQERWGLADWLLSLGADIQKINYTALVGKRRYVAAIRPLWDRLSEQELMAFVLSNNKRLRRAAKAYIKRKFPKGKNVRRVKDGSVA